MDIVDDTETYMYDWSNIKGGKGRNKDAKRLEHLTTKVVKKRILPPVGKGKNSSGAPATWIDRYFRNIQFRLAHDGSLKKPMYPRSEIIKKPSIDLQSSLKMFFQEASFDADDWTNVNRMYGDRRSFHRFLNLIKRSGLEKYASHEDTFLQDDDSKIRYRRDRYWLSKKESSDVVDANKCYDGSFSLIRLLQRIRFVSGDDFRREQAKLLESFLNQLINIQKEQRFVAKRFSEHLEQLKWSDAVDGRDTKAAALLKQQQTFNSLYIMSRESAWLLKRLKDFPFTSPSSIEESNKILDIISAFIPKFMKSKELLYGHYKVHPLQLLESNNGILDSFRGHIKDLQEQGVERNSLAETLLGCFVHVVDMYYNLAELGKDTSFSVKCPFSEAAKETSKLINEAVDKLNSVKCFDLTCGGSPLGCISLWRILFESSLINLRLDLIRKNYSETVKLGVKLFGTATNDQLDQIRLSIDKLLTVGESVLVEFIVMHKTVAQVCYMLGDAFTTGGAGMRGLSDAVLSSGTSSEHDDQLMDFNPEDFPWNKHNVRTTTISRPNSKDWPKDMC